MNTKSFQISGINQVTGKPITLTADECGRIHIPRNVELYITETINLPSNVSIVGQIDFISNEPIDSTSNDSNEV